MPEPKDCRNLKKDLKMTKILLVGAGLTNAVIYTRLIDKKILPGDITIVEARNTIGGNCYTEKIGIDASDSSRKITVHKYGAHIFHTYDKSIWDFANRYGHFRPYIHQPIAIFSGKVYNLPFNMNTFSRIFDGVNTPSEAMYRIHDEIASYRYDRIHKDPAKENDLPCNLEEAAIQMVGTTIYETLIKGYTEKQWGMPCDRLAPGIIRRIPLRFTFDNNYFGDTYQGIPEEGYTEWISNMFGGHEIIFGAHMSEFPEMAKKYDLIYYSGALDDIVSDNVSHNERALPYRTVRFREEILSDTQGCAVINYTGNDVPYTRAIEHKYFNSECLDIPSTVRSYEYSGICGKDDEPCYPINNQDSANTYNMIRNSLPQNIIPVGRLGLYKYLDMDDAIKAAMEVNMDEK